MYRNVTPASSLTPILSQQLLNLSLVINWPALPVYSVEEAPSNVDIQGNLSPLHCYQVLVTQMILTASQSNNVIDLLSTVNQSTKHCRKLGDGKEKGLIAMSQAGRVANEPNRFHSSSTYYVTCATKARLNVFLRCNCILHMTNISHLGRAIP